LPDPDGRRDGAPTGALRPISAAVPASDADSAYPPTALKIRNPKREVTDELLGVVITEDPT
jgi:hypothetical protein